MKFLIYFALILFSLPLSAGPGDDPVVPWPTLVDLEKMSTKDLEGSWTAFSHNTIWFLDISIDPENKNFARFKLTSNALFTHHGEGLLLYDGSLFFGKITLDSRHIYDAFLFKEHGGIKLRIVQGPLKYFDLDLNHKE